MAIPAAPTTVPRSEPNTFPSHRLATWLRGFLIVSICLGVFFRLYHLDGKVLWEDELFGTIHMMGYSEAQIVEGSPSFTRAAALQQFFRLPNPSTVRPLDVSGTVGSLAREDPQHPPLFYVAGHLWVALFGSSVAAMRALPALFGLIALPCMYFLCRELFTSRALAWLGTALLATSPFHVLYAQEMREYSLWTVAILAVCLTFLRALRTDRVRDWTLFAIALTTSMYVFPFTGFVAIGEGLFLLATCGIGQIKRWIGYLVSCAASFMLFLPWLMIMMFGGGLFRGLQAILTTRQSTKEIATNLLHDVRAAFFDFGLYPLAHASTKAVYPVVTIFLVIALGYAIFTQLRSDNRRVLVFALLALCLPVMVLPLHDWMYGGILVMQARYFTPLYIGLELVLVAGFSQAFAVTQQGALAVRTRFARLTAAVFIVGLLVGGTVSCLVSSQSPTWSTKDFEQNRLVADAVNRSSDPIVVSDFHTSRLLGLGYYLDPDVRLKLRLRCDTCSVPPVHRPISLTDATGTVFLVGASPDLQRQAATWAARAGSASQLRTIGIQTFPDRHVVTNSLLMFAPI